MYLGVYEADHSDIEDIFRTTEELTPMLDLQRSTARRMIGGNVQVACLDGRLVDGHLDWCSDNEIAVHTSGCRCVIPLDNVVGLVRRSA